jgi:hypothetical protein
VQDFALRLQIPDGAGDILDRNLRIDAVLNKCAKRYIPRLT